MQESAMEPDELTLGTALRMSFYESADRIFYGPNFTRN